MEEYVISAIRVIGARRVAEALGMSRTAALSIAAGVAREGTLALARQNLQRLQDIYRPHAAA